MWFLANTRKSHTLAAEASYVMTSPGGAAEKGHILFRIVKSWHARDRVAAQSTSPVRQNRRRSYHRIINNNNSRHHFFPLFDLKHQRFGTESLYLFSPLRRIAFPFPFLLIHFKSFHFLTDCFTRIIPISLPILSCILFIWSVVHFIFFSPEKCWKQKKGGE